eukprot:PhM_4_TR8194/c0_g1_i1/m.69260
MFLTFFLHDDKNWSLSFILMRLFFSFNESQSLLLVPLLSTSTTVLTTLTKAQKKRRLVCLNPLVFLRALENAISIFSWWQTSQEADVDLAATEGPVVVTVKWVLPGLTFPGSGTTGTATDASGVRQRQTQSW